LELEEQELLILLQEQVELMEVVQKALQEMIQYLKLLPQQVVVEVVTMLPLQHQELLEVLEVEQF
jgi:hypothetical protein